MADFAGAGGTPCGAGRRLHQDASDDAQITSNGRTNRPKGEAVRFNKVILATGATLIGLFAAASTASAQAPSRATEASPEQGVTLGELVVTAQKREEKLHDVPIAITAFTAAQRDLVGIQTLQDIVKFTPGMSYGGPNGAISVRGIGRVTNAFGTDPGVAEYYDGVYQSDTSFVALAPFLADRTEILRGPQGTLYGRNSIGGAINIISKRPTETFTGDVEQTVGSYETSFTGIRVSGPLTDKLKGLLAATYDYQGKGYIHNVAGKDTGTRETPSIEAQLQFDPTENLQIWAKYDVSFLNVRPTLANASAPYATSGESFSGLVLNPFFHDPTPNPGIADIRKNAIDFTGYERESRPTQTFTLQASWNLGHTTLKYTGGFTTFNVLVRQDFDYGARPNFVMPYTGVCVVGYCPYPNGIPVSTSNILQVSERSNGWSNELNWSSNGDGALTWILGLYQYGENTHGGFALQNPGQVELQAPVGGGANPEGAYLTSNTSLKTDSYAVFGQGDYKLSDALTATVGLRYTRDHKTGSEFQDLVFFNPNLTSANQAFDLGSMTRDVAGRWSGFTGRLGLAWRPDADTNVFGSISRGYKSGGFALSDFDIQPDVSPEHLDAYEAGWKQRIGSRWQFDTAIFYYRYKNLQSVVTVDQGAVAGGAPNGLYLSSLINVPKARSYGFEEEAIFSPTQALRFTLSYGYLNAKFVNFNGVIDTTSTNPAPQDLAGSDLVLSPRNKVTLNGLYIWDFDAGSLTGSATYSWTDKQYSSIFNTALSRLDSSSTVDARLTWEGAAKRYQLIGFVSNVFDTTSETSVAAGSSFVALPGFTGARLRSLNPPRLFGAQVKYHF